MNGGESGCKVVAVYNRGISKQFKVLMFTLCVCPQVQLDGKFWYLKHLYELKPEELPCPKPTREDVMASEQPSGRRDQGSSSSIFSFASSGSQLAANTQQTVLALFFTTLLFIAPTFFTQESSVSEPVDSKNLLLTSHSRHLEPNLHFEMTSQLRLPVSRWN